VGLKVSAKTFWGLSDVCQVDEVEEEMKMWMWMQPSRVRLRSFHLAPTAQGLWVLGHAW